MNLKHAPLFCTALGGLAIGFGIAFASRETPPPGPGSERSAGMPNQSRQLSGLSPDHGKAQLDGVAGDRVWVDVPEDLFQARLGHWVALATPHGMQEILANALDIDDQGRERIGVALKEASEQFHQTELELHRITETDRGLVVTVPAFPERGEEILADLRNEIVQNSSEGTADVVMAIVEGSFAREVGDFGRLEKEITWERRDGGGHQLSTKIGGERSHSVSSGIDHTPMATFCPGF